MASHPRAVKRLPWQPMISGAALLIVIGLLSCLSIFLRVQTVSCLVETQPCPADVSQKLNLQGRQLLFSDHQRQITTDLAGLPYQVVKVSLVLPHTVVAELKPQPSAYQLLNNGQVYLVDQSGLLFQVTQPMADLPIIQVSHANILDLTQREVPAATHQFWLEAAAGAKDLGFGAMELRAVNEATILIRLADSLQAVISNEQPLLQLERLQTILKQQAHTTPKEPIHEIDLRFRLPVLRTTTTISF